MFDDFDEIALDTLSYSIKKDLKEIKDIHHRAYFEWLQNDITKNKEILDSFVIQKDIILSKKKEDQISFIKKLILQIKNLNIKSIDNI